METKEEDQFTRSTKGGRRRASGSAIGPAASSMAPFIGSGGEGGREREKREPNPGRFLEKQQVRGKFKYFSQHSRSPHRRHSEELEEVTGT